MATPLKISLQFSPEIDEAKLEHLMKIISESVETGAQINFNEPAVKSAVEELNKLIDSTINNVELNASIDNISQAIFSAGKEMDKLAKEHGTLEIDADSEQAMKSINEVAEEFEKTKKAAQDALAQQQKTIAALAHAGKIDTPEYSQAVKEAKDLKAVLDKVAQAEEQAASATDDISEGFERVKKLTQDEYANQQKLLTALIATGKVDTPEYEEAVKQANNLKDSLDKIKAAEEQAAEAAGGITPEMKNAQEEALKFLAASEAFSKIGETFGGLAEKGEEYNKGLRKLQATTGATGAELKQLQNDAKEVFVSGVGESASQALEIMGEAKATLGKVFKGDELKELTINLGNTAAAFGKEAGEVFGKAQSFTSAFGITGKESADLIALALKDGKTAGDDVLDVLGEFSPQLKLAGFSAAEFTGLISQAGKSGAINMSLVGDAVKETGLRLKNGDVKNELQTIITDMGDRFPEALQKTLDGVASAAQKGQISTKDALAQSTAAIEQSFKGGKIDELMRGKLQFAFAGTPAEEVGGEMYAKIFGAPIDENTIKAKAAAANAQIQQSMGTQTLADKFSKQFAVIEEKAASAILPLSKGIAGVASSAPSLLAIKQFLPDKAIEAVTGKFKDMAGMAGKLKGALGGGSALMNPYVLGAVAAGAALTYFFTQTDQGKEILESLGKKWDEFYAKAKPVLEAVGGLLSDLIGGIIGNIVTELEVMGDVVGEVFSVLIDLGKEVAEFLGLTSGGSDSSSTFTEMADAVNSVGVIVNSVFAGIQAAMKGFGEVIKKLIHLDFSGALEEAEKIGPKIAGAMKASSEKDLKKLKIEGLQKSISAGLEIKDSLDKNGEIKKLVSDYKNATDNVTKQNLADQIAKQVPGAVHGMKAVVDEATGKVKESYDIAIDEADKFANDQGAILDKQIGASKNAFIQLLQDQVTGLEESKKKLAELATKTVTAKSPEEQAAALKAYDEEKKKIEEQSKAIAGTVAQGKGLGIGAENLQAMAENAGLSKEASKKLAGVMDDVTKQTKKALVETGALAKAYNDAQTAASNMQSSARQAAVQATLNAQALKKQIAASNDPEQRKQLKQDLAGQLAAKDANIKKDEEATAQLNATSEIEKAIQKRSGESAETSLQRAQRKITVAGTQLDLDLQAFKILQDSQILDAKRERTAGDDFVFAHKELEVSEEKLRVATKQLAVGGASAEQQKQVIDAISKQVVELGKIDLDKLSPNIRLLVDEKGFGEGVQSIKEQIAGLVLDAQSKKVALRAGFTIDFNEVAILQHDLEKRKLELDISIGVKDDRAMAEFIGNDLEKAQQKLTDGQTKLANLNKALGEAVTESAKVNLRSQIQEQLKSNIEQENAVLDLQQSIDDSYRAFYDSQAADLQKNSDRELELQTRLFDKRSEIVERSLTIENELIVANTEKRNEELNATLDAAAAERSKKIDDNASDELKQLDEIQKLGLLSELEYISQKTEIEANAEKARKDEADRIAKEKEDAEREHQQELTRIAAQESGKRLLLETEKLKRELTSQKKTLQEQYKIAKQKAELPTATKADKDAAELLSTQLDDITTTLEDKGNIVAVMAGEVGSTLQDAVAGMFDGNEEVMADSFRKLFSMLSGALKQLASSFVLDIVLQSPFIKSAIAINPFLGAAITAGATGVIRGLTNALLSPVLDGLLSFASGGAVTQPTLAMIGDASKLGGMNKEWIMRDKHIEYIAYNAGRAATDGLSGKMDTLIREIRNIGGEWRLKGQDLVIAFRRAEASINDRLI